MPQRQHGTAQPRGLDNISPPRVKSYDGRFGRMFGGLNAAFDPENEDDKRALRAIADSMRETDDAPSADTRGCRPAIRISGSSSITTSPSIPPRCCSAATIRLRC